MLYVCCICGLETGLLSNGKHADKCDECRLENIAFLADFLKKHTIDKTALEHLNTISKYTQATKRGHG